MEQIQEYQKKVNDMSARPLCENNSVEQKNKQIEMMLQKYAPSITGNGRRGDLLQKILVLIVDVESKRNMKQSGNDLLIIKQALTATLERMEWDHQKMVEPFKECLVNVQKLMDELPRGEKIKLWIIDKVRKSKCNIS
jgi:hypothetical protein